MADEDTTEVEQTEEQTSTTSAETDTDQVTLTKAEVDALRKQAAEGQKAARRAKADAEKREADKAKAEGRWEEIAKENERKATEAQQALEQRDNADRATAAARRLKFKSPELAIKFLDPDDLTDAALTEQALKKVLAEYPELKVPDQRKSGTSISNGADDTGTPEKDPLVGIAKDLGRHFSGNAS